MGILSLSEFFIIFFSAVYLYYPESVDPALKTSDTPQSSVQTNYDFIIVGAGSAGCVVARRLTDNSNWNVLLIEAGSDEDPVSDAPLLSSYTHGSEMDWNYTTVKQQKACLSHDGICPYPRGKAMGGSSSINGMMYVRGNRADYDDWVNSGNIGWSYEDVLPYFIKAENNTEPSLASSPFHGSSGPLNVQYPRYVTHLREKYVKAAEEFGWQRGDYNGERQDVAGYLQLTVDGASRENTAKAYLNPIRSRKTLSVVKKATATKIIIENGKAIGVEYFRKGEIHTVYAKEDIILSAGAIDTPKLLMLSGIGPREDLAEHNIKVEADLPVGKYLQDHLLLSIPFEIKKEQTISAGVWMTEDSIRQYTEERSGPLTSTGAEAMAFLKTKRNLDQPDLQLIWASGPTTDQNRTIMTIVLCNVKPKSRGSVKLKSGDWKDPPLIDPNYFAESGDFEVFRKGVEYAFRYMRTPTMARLSPTLYTDDRPACRGKTGAAFVDCLIYQYTGTIYHPVSTARMGKPGESVVDHNLQVHGIPNLRVIDASAIPSVPGGNTNAPTIMLAEKGADIIRAYYSDL